MTLHSVLARGRASARYRLGKALGRPAASTRGSQNGEEALLARLITEATPQWFADVGANDGCQYSNSLWLAELGWSGVLVEPHPEAFSALRDRHGRRPNLHLHHAACAESEGTGKLFLSGDQNSLGSTLSVDDNAWLRHWRSPESVDVPIRRLESLLQDAGCPRDYGILLIDTEGFDLDVLRGAGLDTFRPRIVVTEEYLWNMEKNAAKHRHLWDQGYVFLDKIGENTIWIEQAQMNDELLARHFQFHPGH